MHFKTQLFAFLTLVEDNIAFEGLSMMGTEKVHVKKTTLETQLFTWACTHQRTLPFNVQFITSCLKTFKVTPAAFGNNFLAFTFELNVYFSILKVDISQGVGGGLL